MAVSSIASPGNAPNWHCTRCELSFLDSTDNKPCPRCHLDDALIEREAPKAAPAAKPAFGGKAAAAPSKMPTSSGKMLGIGALAVGVPLWLEGARTTRDGWVLFLNWVLERLGAPALIPQSAVWPWWAAIGALILLGVAYSHIEVKQTPLTIRPWRINHTWQVWVTWIVFIISDVGTMYLGARSPRAGDPALLHQIASVALAAGVYAIIITFVPERLVMFGWRKLRG